MAKSNGTKSNGTTFNASIPPRQQGEDWLNFGTVWFNSEGRGVYFLRLSKAQLEDALKHLDEKGNYEVKVPLIRKQAKPAQAGEQAAAA